MVLRPITFIKQLIWLLYPVLMLEKKVKWWSLLFALLIYCYCLQRLVTSLKFVLLQQSAMCLATYVCLLTLNGGDLAEYTKSQLI